MMVIRFLVGLALAVAMGLGPAAAEPVRPYRLVAESSGSPLQPIIEWFERAHREYQGVVIKELSVSTGTPPRLPQTAADIVGARAPSLLERVRGWLGFGPGSLSREDVASGGTSAGISEADKAELEVRIRRQIEAREEERRRSDEDARIAEARHAAERAVEAAKVPAKPPQPGSDDQAKVAAAEPAPSMRPEAVPPPPSQPNAEPPQSVPKFETKPFSTPQQAPPSPLAEIPAPKRVEPDEVESKSVDATAARVADAHADMPKHWNHIPRTPPKLTVSEEAAQRLAADASSEADKILMPKDSVTRVAAEAPRLKHRGCARAGRTVGLPATYTVKKGDSLWAIARRYYNSGPKYVRIVRANEPTLSDPDLIHPCQRIYLPKRHAWLLLQRLMLEPT